MPVPTLLAAAEPPDDDITFALIRSALADLRHRDRNEILAFLDYWRDLPREDRAVFAKVVKPDLTDEQVARLAGVAPRTLYRWDRYQGIKPRLDDRECAERRRKPGQLDA